MGKPVFLSPNELRLQSIGGADRRARESPLVLTLGAKIKYAGVGSSRLYRRSIGGVLSRARQSLLRYSSDRATGYFPLVRHTGEAVTAAELTSRLRLQLDPTSEFNWELCQKTLNCEFCENIFRDSNWLKSFSFTPTILPSTIGWIALQHNES